MNNAYSDQVTSLLVELQEAEISIAPNHQLDELWNAVVLQTDAQRLLALGAALNKNGYSFWLRLWRLVIRQRLVACGVARPPVSSQLGILAIEMLHLACQGDQNSLTNIVQQIARSPQLQEAQLPFETLRARLERGANDEFSVSTPHITRPRLVQILKGIPGMSSANISRQVSDGLLIAQDRMGGGQNHRGAYARYRHIDPAVNFQIAETVCLALEKSPK